MKYAIVSGYFDPLHTGHIDYLESAKKLGDKLIVIVNNDGQAMLKKGFSFMDEDDRKELVSRLGVVDHVVKSCDTDRSVCASLKMLRERFPSDELVFANGGDQTDKTIPEIPVCNEAGIRMEFNVGGSKTRASSDLLERYYRFRKEREERQ